MWTRGSEALNELLLQCLDRRRRADGGGLVRRRAADRGRDQVGRADDRARLRRAAVADLIRDLLPALAAEQVGREGRAGERVAVGEVDERDAARRVVLAHDLLLG